MPDRIIALIDDSIYAQSVCEHAAWAAQSCGWPVELVHVLGRREALRKSGFGRRLAPKDVLLEQLDALDSERLRVATGHATVMLEDARAQTASYGAGEVTTRLIQGDLVETVTAPEARSAMIVIGKRGEAADFAQGHLGSNLERVARASAAPVLVAARAFRPIRRVLLAFDGGTSSRRAADQLAEIPLLSRCAIELATVGDRSAGLQAAVEEAILRLRAAGLRAEETALEGEPEEALLARIEAGGHDLVVMGAYGHSRIRNLIIGSTTTQMLIGARLPVLLFR